MRARHVLLMFSLLMSSVLALSACGGGGGFSAAVADNFVGSCVDNGGSRPVCACALGEIEALYSEQEFSRVEARMRAGEPLPDDILDAVAGCKVIDR